MAVTMVVVHSFERYNVGDIVSDKTEIANIVGGEHANRAVRVLMPTTIYDQTEDN